MEGEKMTPLSFEWQWNADYFIFMGLLYLAIVIIGAGLIYTYIKTWFHLGDRDDGSQEEVPSRGKYGDY
jgi:hypothetical protein